MFRSAVIISILPTYVCMCMNLGRTCMPAYNTVYYTIVRICMRASRICMLLSNIRITTPPTIPPPWLAACGLIEDDLPACIDYIVLQQQQLGRVGLLPASGLCKFSANSQIQRVALGQPKMHWNWDIKNKNLFDANCPNLSFPSLPWPGNPEYSLGQGVGGGF